MECRRQSGREHGSIAAALGLGGSRFSSIVSDLLVPALVSTLHRLYSHVQIQIQY